MDSVSNFGKANLIVGITSSGSAIELKAGEVSSLPSVPFNCVLFNSTDYSSPIEDPYKELVRVTAISGNYLSVSRAQEGTTAFPHNQYGKTYTLLNTITKKTIDDIRDAIEISGSSAYINASGDSMTGTLTGPLFVGTVVSGGSILGTSGTFGTLNASTISGTIVSGGSIVGTNGTFGTLNANVLSGTTVNGTTVTGGSILGDSIYGTTISGGSIFGDSISGTTISGNAIRGTSGTFTTVNATVLSGTTVSGATINATSTLTLNASKVITTGANLSGGTGVYSTKTNNTLNFKSIVGGGLVTISSDTNTITISGNAGAATVSGPNTSTPSGIVIWNSSTGGALENSNIAISGNNLLPVVSGTQNIGSASLPFNEIWTKPTCAFIAASGNPTYALLTNYTVCSGSGFLTYSGSNFTITATNPHRITYIGSSPIVGRIDVNGSAMASAKTSSYRIGIMKNGYSGANIFPYSITDDGTGQCGGSVNYILPIVSGDYFQVGFCASAAGSNITSTNSSFQMAITKVL